MPRRPKPWYKKSHDAWYVKLKGKLVRLGATEADAWKEFHRMMADGDAGTVRKAVPGGRVLLGDVLDAWIEAKRTQVKPKTLDMMRMFAQSLLKFAPRMKAADVRPTTLADWVASHPRWGQTTHRRAISLYVRPSLRIARYRASSLGLIPRRAAMESLHRRRYEHLRPSIAARVHIGARFYANSRVGRIKQEEKCSAGFRGLLAAGRRIAHSALNLTQYSTNPAPNGTRRRIMSTKEHINRET
jgi:hypothetical protein